MMMFVAKRQRSLCDGKHPFLAHIGVRQVKNEIGLPQGVDFINIYARERFDAFFGETRSVNGIHILVNFDLI